MGALKEGSAPVTAYKTGTETVLLGRQIGGDNGKDIQRKAIYVDFRSRITPNTVEIS